MKKRKSNNGEKLLIITINISIPLLILGVCFLNYEIKETQKQLNNLKSYQYNFLESPINDTKDIIYNCAGKGLEEQMYCLRDEINKIYHYNITDDRINLSFKELKQRGGDCRDWNSLYSSLVTKLGYEMKQINIPSGINTRHVFILAFDESGYCLLDQTKVNCFMYGKK